MVVHVRELAVSSVPAVRREAPSMFIAAFGSGSLR
jgi:hypothetical protein